MGCSYVGCVLIMSEIELNIYCPNCKSIQTIMFAGSGTKGRCMGCDYEFPRELHFKELM